MYQLKNPRSFGSAWTDAWHHTIIHPVFDGCIKIYGIHSLHRKRNFFQCKTFIYQSSPKIGKLGHKLKDSTCTKLKDFPHTFTCNFEFHTWPTQLFFTLAYQNELRLQFQFHVKYLKTTKHSWNPQTHLYKNWLKNRKGRGALIQSTLMKKDQWRKTKMDHEIWVANAYPYCSCFV